jgi:hypothetical protein
MKSKIAPILLFAIVLTIVFFGIKVYRNPNSLNWLTQSPTDLIPIEGRPGEYRVRGVQPEGQNPSTSAVATQPTYQNPMPINDYEWHGVQCLESNMRITSRILTPGVWWQVRFNHDDSTIMDLYPKDWKGQTMLVVTNSYNTQEWRIKPGSKITHALVAWEITPDTGVAPR